MKCECRENVEHIYINKMQKYNIERIQLLFKTIIYLKQEQNELLRNLYNWREIKINEKGDVFDI